MAQGMDPGSTGDDSNGASDGRGPIRPQGGIAPPPPIVTGGYPAVALAPKQKSILSKVGTYILVSIFSLSLLGNFYLGAIVAATMRGPQEAVYEDGDVKDRIVIIPLRGLIGNDTAGFVRRSLKHLRENEPKAIILRVDSPGGGVGASDRIWHAITEFRKEVDIPVVASYGSYAASGGYYTSVMSDYIFAEPTTITGSIGVIVQAFTAGDLLETVGIKPEVVAASDANMKDVMNWTRDWTDRDRDTLKHFLDVDHKRFIEIVYNGRKDHMSKERAGELATGEPYSAEQALESKLIDEVGYLSDAIAKAASLAGLGSVKPRVTIIQPARGLMDAIMSGSSSPDRNAFTVENLRNMLEEVAIPRMEYRMH